jgi:hypothetical protein
MEMSFVTIKARIAEDLGDERRQVPRQPVELDAKMRELGASGVEAKVLNISERGFMAVAEGKMDRRRQDRCRVRRAASAGNSRALNSARRRAASSRRYPAPLQH